MSGKQTNDMERYLGAGDGQSRGRGIAAAPSEKTAQRHAAPQRRSVTRKTIAMVGVLAALAGTTLAGCAEPKAVPADDEYAGADESFASSSSDDSAAWSSGSGSSASATGSGELHDDTGTYKDGTYKATSTYGPVGEDSIDVSVTVKSDTVTDVQVVGHAFTPVSEGHQNDFIAAIGGEVDGKPLKDLSVDKVAGASWTSDAFNAALDVVRQEAAAE